MKRSSLCCCLFYFIFPLWNNFFFLSCQAVGVCNDFISEWEHAVGPLTHLPRPDEMFCMSCDQTHPKTRRGIVVERLLFRISDYILPRMAASTPTLHRQHRDAVTHDECFPKYDRFNYFEMDNLSPTHCLAKHKPLKMRAGWWSLWEERAFLLNKIISAYI